MKVFIVAEIPLIPIDLQLSFSVRSVSAESSLGFACFHLVCRTGMPKILQLMAFCQNNRCRKKERMYFPA